MSSECGMQRKAQRWGCQGRSLCTWYKSPIPSSAAIWTSAGTSSSSSVKEGGWSAGMCKQSILAMAGCIDPRRAADMPIRIDIIVTSWPCTRCRAVAVTAEVGIRLR
eukprot:scaffold6996_cov112-Isochrysis_galbana.AAC.3